MKIQGEERSACSNEKSSFGCFVGIVSLKTEYVIALKDGIIACSAVRGLLDNAAYDKKCIEEVDIKYTNYVKAPGQPRLQYASCQHRTKLRRTRIPS